MVELARVDLFLNYSFDQGMDMNLTKQTKEEGTVGMPGVSSEDELLAFSQETLGYRRQNIGFQP